MNAVPAAFVHVKASRLKALASTSRERHPLLPATPTFVESGVSDFVSFQWYGMLGPAGMSQDVVAVLNRQINKALNAAEVRERFTGLTLGATPGTPVDFLKLLECEDRRWPDVQKKVNVRLD